MDRFREGRESVDDDAREGRPSTSRVDENIQRVHDLVMSDRRITTRMIAAELAISKGSVQTLLKKDLNMRKLCAKCTLALGAYCARVFRQKRHAYHGPPSLFARFSPCDFFVP